MNVLGQIRIDLGRLVSDIERAYSEEEERRRLVSLAVSERCKASSHLRDLRVRQAKLEKAAEVYSEDWVRPVGDTAKAPQPCRVRALVEWGLANGWEREGDYLTKTRLGDDYSAYLPDNSELLDYEEAVDLVAFVEGCTIAGLKEMIAGTVSWV